MQNKIDSHSDDINNEIKSGSFKYILFFIIFFAVGTTAGIFLTKKLLLKKEDVATPVKLEEVEEDISNKAEYQEVIKGLKYLIGENLMFYNAKGLDASKLNNDQKLQIAYEYVMKDTTLETAIAFPTYWESQVCNDDFLVDLNTNDDGSTYNAGICTYYVLPKSKVLEAYKNIFNNDNIDLVTFTANEHYKCVVGEENYSCGLIKRIDYSGKIENHFQQRKVTKDKEDTIFVYESGYLKDTRSFVNIAEDGFDNYYLHSSDSTLYYYELRSADNITFKHVFKKDSNGKYYYVKTEVA